MTDQPRLRFSLRTLMWLMLVVAAFFGGRASMGPQLQRGAAEREQLRAENDRF
jgi:hypothetical protein